MSQHNVDMELSQFAFKHDRNCLNSPLTRNILGIIYDIFTIIISLLDIITDVIVLIEFYIHGKIFFFSCSLTILIIAQLAYTVAFWWKFKDATRGDGAAVMSCCCLLPFAPLLSFAFFFTENKDKPLHKCIYGFFETFDCDYDCFNSKNDNKKYDETQALKEWAAQKLSKHIGFIIEAMIEAFPQSVLQSIAIVYYHDYNNYIAMFSILLSIISVSTKTFILSVNISYNWKYAIFNWLCCLVDFIAIFCIVSFIFYTPETVGNDIDINPFVLLQRIWIYCILVTVVPFVLIVSIILNAYFSFREGCIDSISYFAVVSLLQIFWIIGLFLSLMAMIISVFVIFAMLLMINGLSQRISNDGAAEFYLPLLYFVNNAKKINIDDYYEERVPLIISRKQHQIVRICCINRVLFESMKASENVGIANTYEHDLNNYLIQKAVVKNTDDYPFSGMTLKDIKSHCNNGELYRLFCKKIYQSMSETFFHFIPTIHVDSQYEFISLFILYFFVPLYFIGRIFNALFIIFMILYLYFQNIDIFSNDIPLFQTVIVCCYMLLLLLWIILLFFVLKEQYNSLFILPSTKHLMVTHEIRDKTMEIMDYYNSVISQFVAQRYCIQLFGKDVTIIIMQLYGVGFDKFDKAKLSI